MHVTGPSGAMFVRHRRCVDRVVVVVADCRRPLPLCVLRFSGGTVGRCRYAVYGFPASASVPPDDAVMLSTVLRHRRLRYKPCCVGGQQPPHLCDLIVDQ
jgi:hypothetical protein